MSHRLNLTNEERLERYPHGRCPLCNANNWSYYYDPEDDERGAECSDCGEQFPSSNASDLGFDGDPFKGT